MDDTSDKPHSEFLPASLWTEKAFAGSWRPLNGAMDVVEPATGAVLGRTATANANDIQRACSEAARAQHAWAQTTPDVRRTLLLKVARLLQQHHQDITQWLVREGGSIPPKADAEMQLAISEALESSALPTRAVGKVYPNSPGRLSFAQRVPLGLVGVITPWNFPLILALRAIAPALALGNAIVLKPDLKTAISGGVIIARLFELAGLPEGVLQVLPGGPEAGEALVSDPHVNLVSFTGSTRSGRRVGEIAGRALKRVQLELGGNNAFIVLDDADVDIASSNGAWASYLHQGQICMSAGRHLIHESVAAAYIERLTHRASQLPVGDPNCEQVALGPMINESQVQRLDDIVQRSVKAGAKIEIGGTFEGLFYQPTVLSNVTATTPAFVEELFGPVAPVTTFKNDEEALALVNASPYGLTAGIHGSSGRAMALAQRIKSGMVHVNDQTVNVDALTPFGGMGYSGNGARFGATANLEEFTQWQWITLKNEANAYPF